MTVLTAGACKFIVTSAGNVIPAAVGSATGVIVTGVKLWIQSEPAKVALATAMGTGASSGAISGAIVSKTIASAASGALLGSLTAAGLGSVLAGSMAVAAGGIGSTPLGMLAVGTRFDENQITHDCWKPVIHDTSSEPSQGMMLRELLCHPHVASVNVTYSAFLPQIILENIWKEKFEIEYVALQDAEKLCCHANRLSA